MKHRVLTCLILCAGLMDMFAANYTIQLGNVTWTGSAGGYACFSSAVYPNTVNFTITKLTNGRKNYAVTAGPSRTTGSYTRQLRSGVNTLNYALYTTSAMTYQLKAPTVAIPSEVISGSTVGLNGQIIPLSFIFSVPSGQVVPPGTYTDQVTFSVYPAYDSVGIPDTTVTITFSATVAADAAVAVVPPGGAFSGAGSQLLLDFGALQTGQNKSCDVLIQQNSSCIVSYSSANGGVLKQLSAASADQIPYSVSVSGMNFDLAQPHNVTLPAGVSPQPNGNRYPLIVTIGAVNNAAAGTYQDEITISIMAQ
jgi:spore coat protein U-like protein